MLPIRFTQKHDLVVVGLLDDQLWKRLGISIIGDNSRLFLEFILFTLIHIDGISNIITFQIY